MHIVFCVPGSRGRTVIAKIINHAINQEYDYVNHVSWSHSDWITYILLWIGGKLIIKLTSHNV